MSWRDLRSALPGHRSLTLLAALAASGVLLAAPWTGQTQEARPLTAAQAWPHAHRGTTPPDLADGAAYEPLLFLDAVSSVGTAPTSDGESQRLVLRRPDGTIRQLRRLPASLDPSFPAAAVVGNQLVWVESTTHGQGLFGADLRGGVARPLTGDLGDARFYDSQYDLVIADGRVHWVAAGPENTTELRSVALGGGTVDVRDEAGEWAQSAWPWMVDGITAGGGATMLRNITTGQVQPVPTSRRGVTACSPVWCQIVSLTKEGTSRIEVMRPDRSSRRTVAEGRPATIIADVAVLDRFEVISELTAASDLTGNVQLLAYDLSTRSTVEISPDAFAVSYRAGVLWWSTGSQQSFLRHALDLRTV